MLEDGEIAFLNGPLGEAAYLTEARDPGLNYFGEVKRTLISAATKEAVCVAHSFQLSNMALFIIQYTSCPYTRLCSIFLVLFVS